MTCARTKRGGGLVAAGRGGKEGDREFGERGGGFVWWGLKVVRDMEARRGDGVDKEGVRV